MKKLIYLFIAVFLGACNSPTATDQEKTADATESAQLETLNTFAVVWGWQTYDMEQIEKHINSQAEQTMNLWNEGIIENVYFDTKARFTDKTTYPNICFFIKAKNEKEATGILDEMVVIKNNISYYTLYPVGINWLGVNDTLSAANKFVVIWKAVGDDQALMDHGIEQVRYTVDLWEKGIVENAYFDAEGIGQGENKKPPVVFFIKAETVNEAQAILNKMPYVVEGLAEYKLSRVGILWMGRK